MKLKGMTIVRRRCVTVVSLFVVGTTAIVLSTQLSGQLQAVSDRALPGVKALLEARHASTSMQVAVSRVDEGVARAHDASTAIQRIGGDSRATVSMVSEISRALREQSQASEGIATQIEQIARAAESGNGAARAGAAAARTLDQLAERMGNVIIAYRV